MIKSDGLAWLQDFYANECNGDWEHQYGVIIETLDNPGWSLEVDLEETSFEVIEFEPVKIDRSDTDWCHCWKENQKFCGRGGAGNLSEIIECFRQWIDSSHGK